MVRSAFILVLLVSAWSLHAGSNDTVSVYFLFNTWKLTDISRGRIDKMIYSGRIDDHHPVQLIGYADYVGGEAYNLDLSRKRAQSVKEYLIQSGFVEKNIYIIIARGRIERAGMQDNAGYAPDRRVDIVKGAPPSPPLRVDTVLPRGTPPKVLSKANDLDAVAVNQTIRLDNIFFYAGRHTVREDSKPALDHLYDIMVANPKLKIRVEGHVCCIKQGVPDALDEDSGGFVLSANRARAIQQWLIEKGIDPARVTYAGFGKQRPIVPNETTEEEADKNRRVEVRVLAK